MGWGGIEKKKKKHCRDKKQTNKQKNYTPQLKLRSLIHCMVMELHQNKCKKMKWHTGKATDKAFGVGMQYAS